MGHVEMCRKTVCSPSTKRPVKLQHLHREGEAGRQSRSTKWKSAMRQLCAKVRRRAARASSAIAQPGAEAGQAPNQIMRVFVGFHNGNCVSHLSVMRPTRQEIIARRHKTSHHVARVDRLLLFGCWGCWLLGCWLQGWLVVGTVFDGLGRFWVGPKPLLGPFGDALGHSWLPLPALGPLLGRFGVLWAALDRFWPLLGRFSSLLVSFWRALGRS